MRILIIDNHPLFREILSEHFNDFYPSSFVFEAASVEEGRGLMQYKQFDLISYDLNLPGQSCVEEFSLLREEMPEAAIVIISGFGNSNVAQSIIDHGANGYIAKSAGIREIKNALNLILSGEIYISPCMLVDTPASNEADTLHREGKLSGLTPRQREVLQLMAMGLPNKSIATKLFCSEGTIKLHVSAILRAMNVRNRTEAVLEGARLGEINIT